MRALDAALESDDVNATGALSLIRLDGLAQLNQVYGRKAIDSLLKDIGTALNSIVAKRSRWAASRLNGSDFALLAPRAIEADEAALNVQAAMREALENRSMLDDSTTLPGAATIFSHGDTIGELLTRLDGALLTADREGESSINIAHRGEIQIRPVRDQMEDWSEILAQGFRDQKFFLSTYPVLDLNDGILHHEAPVRLQRQGENITAGQFLPWINRLEMSGELDKYVVEHALQLIEDRDVDIGINLSVAAVVDSSFLPWISECLSRHANAARRLWMEVSEPMAFRHLTNFKFLCTRARAYHCKVGIEHIGHQLSSLGQLHDVGVDYLKIDASFVRDIASNAANQTLLRTLCTLGHSIGVLVISEGVRTDEEWAMLKELGVDGGTGPGIKEPGK
ncbi:MAG: GGDEF domain-containing protein, partial [Halieaceae bacterium]|nr:GGDEF domain-containing protein [Halieaceae bacterium]